MIDTAEPRRLLREIRADMAPVAAHLAKMEAQQQSLWSQKGLGETYEKMLKADFVSHRRLKSSVAAAFRLLEEIDANLFAIDKGYRRPAAGRRPDILPFEDDDDAEAFKQPGRTIH